MTAAGNRKEVEIWVGELLPPICIVCGSPAEHQKMLFLKRRMGSTNAIFEALGHLIAWLGGAILIPRILSPREIGKVFQLPVCREHSAEQWLEDRLQVGAPKAGSAVFKSASSKFVEALMLGRESSAEFMGNQLEPRPATNTATFLKSLAEGRDESNSSQAEP